MSSSKQSLILLRGLPGSGKSTLAGTLSLHGRFPVYSVDDYFTNEKGEYKFEFAENHLAYKRCEENVANALNAGIEMVIVDNTFTMEWEMEPYFKLAKEYDCRLHVVTVENYHSGKNIHQVSDEQIRKMAEKYSVKLY
jgi:predicted kinase